MVASPRKAPALTVVPGSARPAAERRSARGDEQILAALRAGDATVADDFYWRVKPTVDRTVRRLVGRLDHDGEDLVQVALVQIIQSVGRYRGDCPLDAWVSAVAANVVYKHIRRRRLERTIFAGAVDEDELPGPAAGGTEAAHQRQVLRRVGDHLGAMRSDRAWAFLLHDVCGYSLDEVAHICGVSVAAAQSRLARGRRELHERIAADGRLAEALDQEEP